MKKIGLIMVLAVSLVWGDEFGYAKEWSVKLNPLILFSPAVPILSDFQLEVEKTINHELSVALQVGSLGQKFWDSYSMQGGFANVKLYGFLNGSMNTSLYLALMAGYQNGKFANNTNTYDRYSYGISGGKLYMFGPFSLNLDAGIQQYFIPNYDKTARLSLDANLLLGFAF